MREGIQVQTMSVCTFVTGPSAQRLMAPKFRRRRFWVNIETKSRQVKLAPTGFPNMEVVMTQEADRKSNKPLRVQVGREFEISKPRFVDTFFGQVLVLVTAAIIATAATSEMMKEDPTPAPCGQYEESTESSNGTD